MNELEQIQAKLSKTIDKIRATTSIHNLEKDKLSDEELFFREDIIKELLKIDQAITQLQIDLIIDRSQTNE